ncbi:MAG: heavy-metal-associated domain-containing protein [Mariniphaga sp.]|nr:heavy-metal-associated domain-containing protein [Mariniphaga sp.]
METLKFKTNVNCGGCIATVTPYLNKVNGIINWKVDTTTPAKIMTVEIENTNADAVIAAMKEAGYKADLI